MQVKDLGESGLINLFRPFCSDAVGDDCAVLGATSLGHSLVVTTDMLVENVHFSDLTTSPQDVGWRAAAANLSDLAAMGASPWGLVLAVGLRPETTVTWIEGVYEGFGECLKTYGTVLVGGDTVRSELNTISVTALGQVPNSQIIYRHSAIPGDLILVTGTHGLSKAGLEILLDPDRAHNLDPSEIQVLHLAHQRPKPRLEVIPLLWQHTDRLSGMDSSDGLADALMQICRSSGVGAHIYWEKISIPDVLAKVAGEQALEWALYGGEDFELVLCMPDRAALKIAELLPDAIIIGEIIPGNGINNLPLGAGFQHFTENLQ